MTACVALMPTKVNAATLTIVPVGTLQKNPGDSIDFIFAFNPQPSANKRVKFLDTLFGFDQNELSSAGILRYIAPGEIVDFTTAVARFRFDVLGSTKDGLNDVFGTILYEEIDESLGTEVSVSDGEQVTPLAGGGDVVPVPEPVPEPLTIFGTATTLGCGALFKRKSSKKTVSLLAIAVTSSRWG